jgi:hypothetical protein
MKMTKVAAGGMHGAQRRELRDESCARAALGDLTGSMNRSVFGAATTFAQIVSEQVGMSVSRVELADRACSTTACRASTVQRPALQCGSEHAHCCRQPCRRPAGAA